MEKVKCQWSFIEMTFVSLIILLMTVETSGDDGEIGIEMKMVTNIFGGGSSKGTNGDNERTGLKQNDNEWIF